MRSSEWRGPSTTRDCPEGANSAWSTNEPASAPTCEPMAAPESVAPRRETPAGSAAPPTAAPAMASARVAMVVSGEVVSGEWGVQLGANSELRMD